MQRRLSRGVRWGPSAAIFIAFALALAACGGDPEESAEPEGLEEASDGGEASDEQLDAEEDTAAPDTDFSEEELVFAPQFGMAYLPHHVMIQRGFLESYLPGIQVEEVELSGGGAVTEQLITGNIDVGYMGPAPFLTAWAAGVDVRIASGLETMPMKLMTWKTEYNSLADIQEDDRIAVPGPTSFQTATLRAAASNEFGDPTRFDNQIVGLPHPDAEAALMGEQEITAHFGQLPFTRRQADAGYTSIITSYDVFGRHTLIVAVVASDFEEERPEVFSGFVAALEDAIAWIAENPEDAAQLSIDLGDSSDIEDLIADITSEEVDWDPVPREVISVAQTLAGIGELDDAPDTIEEITTSNLHGRGAS